MSRFAGLAVKQLAPDELPRVASRPSRQRGYWMSATQSLSGPSAVKSCSTRSGRRAADRSGEVVFHGFPLRALDPMLAHRPLHLVAQHALAGAVYTHRYP
jgi:hypothetical protein